MAVRASSHPRNFPRKRGTTTLGVLVLSVSIVVSAVLVSRRPPPAPVPAATVVAEYDTVLVPVPAEPVTAGTKVKEMRFRNVAFPRRQLPEGALHDTTSIIDAVALTALPANVPLFRANFSLTAGNTNPVIERIPPGMRAMTIRVDATSAVEGWAGSGSVVDVLLVEKDRTAVVAEKVKILSAERSVSPVEGAASPNVPSTVTMLVTQEQCLAINTAIPLGKIAFALRSTRDDAGWASVTFTPDRLKGSAAPSPGRSAVNGYVALKKNGQEERAFALANGRWVRTDAVPDGFFPLQDR